MVVSYNEYEKTMKENLFKVNLEEKSCYFTVRI